jgi:hypothetical protein
VRAEQGPAPGSYADRLGVRINPGQEDAVLLGAVATALSTARDLVFAQRG